MDKDVGSTAASFTNKTRSLSTSVTRIRMLDPQKQVWQTKKHSLSIVMCGVQCILFPTI